MALAIALSYRWWESGERGAAHEQRTTTNWHKSRCSSCPPSTPLTLSILTLRSPKSTALLPPSRSLPPQWRFLISIFPSNKCAFSQSRVVAYFSEAAWIFLLHSSRCLLLATTRSSIMSVDIRLNKVDRVYQPGVRLDATTLLSRLIPKTRALTHSGATDTRCTNRTPCRASWSSATRAACRTTASSSRSMERWRCNWVPSPWACSRPSTTASSPSSSSTIASKSANQANYILPLPSNALQYLAVSRVSKVDSYLLETPP